MRSRFIVVFIALVGAAATAPTGLSANAADDITVKERSGVYHVAARFAVPQSPTIVREVLTDYEQIPRFMPDLRSSVVVERTGCRVVVEQEAVARMMLFSKRIHLLLEVHENADALRFVDRGGTSFHEYHGAWRITPHGEGSIVTYELTAKPAFSVPEFLLTRLLRRDARQMIERLQVEIATRPATVATK